ncbi:MAG: hypothetical protein WAU41_02880 [Gaiellaceae bacterium]
MTDLEILRADLIAARVPRSTRTVVALVVAVAATITAAAFAANHYLGQPAPAHVKATFARLGGWQTADRVNASTARVVAFSAHTVLYGAKARDGYTCLELVGAGGFIYQFLCDRQRTSDGLLLFSGIPEHGTAFAPPPVVIAGRVGARTRSLEARTASGSTQTVPLGLDGFFTFEPAQQNAARRGSLTLYARDAAGTVIGREHASAPIVLDTTGVPPRTVSGVVEDPRAHRALFEIWAYQRIGRVSGCRAGCGEGYAQTGTTGAVDIDKGGHFSFVVPRVRYGHWYVTVEIADARFIPLDLVDATPVPDDAFWARAKAEAARG